MITFSVYRGHPWVLKTASGECDCTVVVKLAQIFDRRRRRMLLSIQLLMKSSNTKSTLMSE